MAYNDVLRVAAERGYIDDVEQWFSFRKARNQTSHTYDGTIATKVFIVIEPFLHASQFLLSQLEKRAH